MASLLQVFAALTNSDSNEAISVKTTASKIKISSRGRKWLALVFFLKRHHSTNILLTSTSSVSKDLFSNTWFLQGVLLEAKYKEKMTATQIFDETRKE